VQSRKDVKQLEEYLLIDKKGKKPIVTGLSVGNKIGSGKAVVIKSVKDIDKFKKGQVLVTYMTDPD
jgi:pyruvate,water dikinase